MRAEINRTIRIGKLVYFTLLEREEDEMQWREKSAETGGDLSGQRELCHKY